MAKVALLLLPAGSLGLVVLGANQSACNAEKTEFTETPVIIGATVDLTKQKDFGAGSQRVLRVAEQQLNAVGGLLGRRVVLDIRDDGGDNKSIAGIAQDFVSKGVAGFVGPSTTEGLEAMHFLFKDAQIPVLSPLTTSPKVPLLQSGKDRYLFRTSCQVENQAKAIARFALGRSFLPPAAGPLPEVDAGNTGGDVDAGPDAGDAGGSTPKPDASAPAPTGAKTCKRMAILFAEDAPGKGSATINALVAEYTNKSYGDAAGTVTSLVITDGQASYEEQVDQVLALRAAGTVDCQTLLMFPADGGKYMREFRTKAAGKPELSAENFPTFGFIRFYQQGFIEAGRVDPKDTTELSRVDGVMGAACNQTRDTSPEWARFMALYNSQFPPVEGATAVSPIPQIYDSVILLALAIEKAKTLNDRVAIRDALYEVSAPPGTSYGPGQLAEAFDAIRQGRDIDYNGASGTFDLDDRGDTLLEVIMWQVSGSTFATIPGLVPTDLRK